MAFLYVTMALTVVAPLFARLSVHSERLDLGSSPTGPRTGPMPGVRSCPRSCAPSPLSRAPTPPGARAPSRASARVSSTTSGPWTRPRGSPRVRDPVPPEHPVSPRVRAPLASPDPGDLPGVPAIRRRPRSPACTGHHPARVLSRVEPRLRSHDAVPLHPVRLLHRAAVSHRVPGRLSPSRCSTRRPRSSCRSSSCCGSRGCRRREGHRVRRLPARGVRGLEARAGVRVEGPAGVAGGSAPGLNLALLRGPGIYLKTLPAVVPLWVLVSYGWKAKPLFLRRSLVRHAGAAVRSVRVPGRAGGDSGISTRCIASCTCSRSRRSWKCSQSSGPTIRATCPRRSRARGDGCSAPPPGPRARRRGIRTP